jgi:hypothetical protein
MANEQNLRPQQPGTPSHNPKGRPKGMKSRKTIASQFLKLQMKAEDIGIELPFNFPGCKQLSLAEIAFLRCLGRVIKRGDMTAYEKIMNQCYGLPVQKNENINMELPLNINIVNKTGDELKQDKTIEINGGE